MTPSVVISLDFEQRWGVAHRLADSPEPYRRNLEGEPEAVFGMLELFAREGVGATWATVGALACSGWDEYFERAPAPPAYSNPRAGFRREWQELDPKGGLHFAPAAVAAIAKAPGQELASHSFSHIFFREPGCQREDVLADSLAVARIFVERFNIRPTSFVFPRNQTAHTDALCEAGILRWRTNPTTYYWNATREDEQSRIVRVMRMIDALAPIGSRRASSGEMRASYFVRFSLTGLAWRLHVNRIRADAKRLRSGEALHLWWHPHNLGIDVSTNLRKLDNLLAELRESAPPDTRFIAMRESVNSDKLGMDATKN